LSVSHAQPDGAGLQVISALRQLFGQLVDPRQPRGVRHKLASVLTITVLTALAGAGNFRQAGDQAADLPETLLAAAGARISPRTGDREPPSAATIRRVVESIDAAHADKLVGRWLAACVAAARAQTAVTGEAVCDRELPEGVDWLDGLAIDGKTVRNSAAPGGGADVRLFSALLHREQVVINQIAVPDHTTEVTQVEDLLDPVDLSGKVVTGDAAHTQGDAAAEYVAGERNADYAITVKGNRDKLLGQIWARMPRPTAGSADYTHEQIVGGRRIVREIWVRPGTGISFPRLKQVFRIRRQVFDLSGQRLSKEYVHGVTSLDSDQATPAQLLGLIRHHWRVEVNHQVRDVTWREDHQHAYTGNGAQVMAMIRNLVLAILRLTGHQQITRTLQRIAADRTRILPILANFPLPAMIN
jgi:predicted transposase YbfD/YdcC